MHSPLVFLKDRLPELSRRVVLLGGLQLAATCFIGGRIIYLQAIDQKEYQDLADSNRISYGLILPDRGLIVDRNGEILAQNIQEYWISLVPEDAGDIPSTLENFSHIIPIGEDKIDAILHKADTGLPFMPILLADKVAWNQVAEVAVNRPALAGVDVDFANIRNYPKGDLFSHIVGYVGPVSQDELDKNEGFESLLIHPKFQIGKTGVEKYLEQDLRGQAGHVKYEVNVHGRKIRELEMRDASAGQSIQLTLDANLQEFAFARLGSEVGSAIVLDLDNGDVLSLVSKPSYDPNLFVEGISPADYRQYLDHQHAPLFDRGTMGLYPPGSTFKMVTALAGLEAGLLTSETHYYCNGSFDLSGEKVYCWKRYGHGQTDLKKSLSESCDVFYYNLALEVGIERIAAMADRFGLGQKFDLPLPNVNPGLIPTKKWKLDQTGAPWILGDTINAAIGQGFVLSSVLQLGVMFARLVSGQGLYPRLIRTVSGREVPVPGWRAVGVNPDNLGKILNGMDAAVNSRLGTGYNSRTIDPNFRIAGKTGTSQVRRMTRQQRQGLVRNEDLPWKFRDHALFGGYGPVENPRYVAVVIVEHGGGGAQVAAPIARDLLMYTHYQRIPPLAAYPAEVHGDIIKMWERLNLQPAQTSPKGKPQV